MKGRSVTFDEEAWPRLRFEKNPLKVVVAQVRFPASHALADPAVHAAIQRAVGDRYPKSLSPVQEVTYTITPQGPTQAQIERSAIRFSDENEQNVIAIGSEMVSFETTSYGGWEDFKAEFERLLALTEEHGAPTEVSRLGLRYVDELILDGINGMAGLGNVLTDGVLGSPDSLMRDPRVIETTQRSSIRLEDDVVSFRHGYVQREDERGQETSIYVIDTDIFTVAPVRWDLAALLDRAERYHTWGTNIFGRSLSRQGIELLGGRER